MHDLVRRHNFRHPEVTYLDHTVRVQQDIVEFYVSMKDIIRMTVPKPLQDLHKYELGGLFRQLSSLPYVIQKVSP